MIYVNPISKYKQLSHHHTKQVIKITRAHTRAHTHMQSPHGYPIRLMHAHTQNHMCPYICPYIHAKLSSIPTRLMQETKQINRIT